MSEFEGIYSQTIEEPFVCPPMRFPTKEEFEKMCKRLWEPYERHYIVSPAEYAVLLKYDRILKRKIRNKKKADRRRKAGE